MVLGSRKLLLLTLTIGFERFKVGPLESTKRTPARAEEKTVIETFAEKGRTASTKEPKSKERSGKELEGWKKHRVGGDGR